MATEATTTVQVFATPAELGYALAKQILDAYAAPPASPFLLGCPAGRSLRSTYHALAETKADLSDLVVVMMDEYVVDGQAVPVTERISCKRFAREMIGGPLGIPDDRIWLPDAADPAAYDERIAAAGGISLFSLASGSSDGHVAFLSPGSPRNGRTAIVEIAETTRNDNLATFPQLRTVEEVPREGVSVGIATILAARRLRLVLHGADKRGATARLLAFHGFDPSWPASLIHAHHDAEILVDRAALGEPRE